MQGKKIVLGIFLFLTFFLSTPFISLAQEAVIETDTPLGVEKTATGSGKEVESSDYELAYPGMLPDHPLYFLKAVRDGLVKFLINDDMKRARFSLLAGEKRIYSASYLIEKNKDQAAVTSISKGNNYLAESIVAIENVRRSHSKNTDTKPFLYQFKASTKKLIQILESKNREVDSKYKSEFKKELERLGYMLQESESILKQK